MYLTRSLLGLLLPAVCALAAESTDAPASKWTAENYQRKTIYHSPQKSGYTSWVGAWIMPDDSIMVSCHQATGSVEGRKVKDYDYSALDLANIYLRSTNGGDTWEKTAEDKFHGPSDRPTWGGSHCALSNGGIIRAVDGSQLPDYPVPRRIFFQRSLDLGKTWGPPEIPPEPKRPTSDYIGDFGDCITRVRRLSDGRLLATGVIKYDPSPKKRLFGEPVLMFSKNEAKTWEPIKIELPAPEMHGDDAWDEWDCAELPQGELLGVFRRRDPDSEPGKAKQVRWQGIFRKKGDSWIVDEYNRAPFEHSGHPELLLTREGTILHIATSGIHWTEDAGKTWHLLEFKGAKKPYRSNYYPRSVQTKDGRIFVFSHSGSDNAYGKVDQAIVMDSFQLALK